MWLPIAGLEAVHGYAMFVAPRLGDLPARQIGVLIWLGSHLCGRSSKRPLAWPTEEFLDVLGSRRTMVGSDAGL